MALAPVAITNRVGAAVIYGDSSSDYSIGRVNSDTVNPLTEDLEDSLGDSQYTVAIADGVRWFWQRFIRGCHLSTDGVTQYLVRYSANGNNPSDATGLYHGKIVAGARGCLHLTTGAPALYAGLHAQSCAISSYGGCPPPIRPSGPGSDLDWDTDILAQTGYVSAADMLSLTYHRTLWADELDYGVTEFGFDLTGAATSPHEFSATLFPMLASAGTHTAAGFSGTFQNDYARKVCLEANLLRTTTTWGIIYSFLAKDETFLARLDVPKYVQPDEMTYTPVIYIQGITPSDYALALASAPYYRVLVKWEAMKANMGSTAMAALLTAGGATVRTPSSAQIGALTGGGSGSDRWRKLTGHNRGWNLRGCGWGRR